MFTASADCARVERHMAVVSLGSPFSASSSSPAFILGAPAELSAARAGLRVRRHVFTRKFQELHQ